MNHTEIAAAMSEVLGVKIEYAPMSIEEFKRKMGNCSPSFGEGVQGPSGG
jgi:hypothetical protein